ncbi:hypothetical protein C0Q70_05749 [Pomacea canaliculata]|uniref:Formin GTPase-binding domain-containing protein n=1 Tax=Pomacea canaliculata TaxID=400727 RepID=A0A2T7PM41_POMCA|nr:hypothetical protein C0Q70_05749 [Pomacea canaliculata]
MGISETAMQKIKASACGTMSGVFRRMSNFVFRFNRKSRSADDNAADDKSKDRKGRRNRPKAEEAKNAENEAATPAPAGVTGPDVTETTRVKEVARAGGPAEGATRAEVHIEGDTERQPQEGSEAEDIMSEDAKGRKKKRGKKDKGKKKGKDGVGKENSVKDQTKPLQDGKKDGKHSNAAGSGGSTNVRRDSQGSGEELAMIKENEDLTEDNTSDVSGNRESSKEDEVSRFDTPLLLNDIESLLKKREKEEEIGSLRSRDSQEQLDAEALLAIQEDAESTNSVESFGASGPDRDRSETSGVGVLKRILRRKISKTLLKVDLEQCEPEICVALLKFPSVQTFSALKKKLKSSGMEWMQGFLDNEGLEALLDCIDSLGSRRVTQLSEALLLLECMSCVKCVMNSKLGLESLVQRPDYICRLVKGKTLPKMIWS